PQCGHSLKAPDNAVGRRARCPSCKNEFTIPDPNQAGGALPPPPPASLGPTEEVYEAEQVPTAPPPPLPAEDDFGDIPLAPEEIPVARRAPTMAGGEDA